MIVAIHENSFECGRSATGDYRQVAARNIATGDVHRSWTPKR